MVDVIRTIKQFPAIAKNVVAIDFVEASPFLKECQQKSLEGLAQGSKLNWYPRLMDVPTGDEFTFFLAYAKFLYYSYS
jgi:hypothetical protein